MVLTPSSLASAAVQKELAFAARKNVPIIPVELRETKESSLPDWYTLDYADLHRHRIDPKRIEDGAADLAAAVQRARRVAKSGSSERERGRDTNGGAARKHRRR
jgi:hypothetical protein